MVSEPLPSGRRGCRPFTHAASSAWSGRVTGTEAPCLRGSRLPAWPAPEQTVSKGRTSGAAVFAGCLGGTENTWDAGEGRRGGSQTCGVAERAPQARPVAGASRLRHNGPSAARELAPRGAEEKETEGGDASSAAVMAARAGRGRDRSRVGLRAPTRVPVVSPPRVRRPGAVCLVPHVACRIPMLRSAAGPRRLGILQCQCEE